MAQTRRVKKEDSLEWLTVGSRLREVAAQCAPVNVLRRLANVFVRNS